MTQNKTVRNSNRRSQQAPGQLYGYSIQQTRMLAHLLRATPGESVSLECVDDVALHGLNTLTLEQDKSGLAHNPIANRSTALWKTLAGWVELIRQGALANETRFVLFVAQPYESTFVRSMHEAGTQEQALQVARTLRQEMWGEQPSFPKRDELPSTIAQYVNSVLKASDAVLVRLIRNFEFEQGSGSVADDLKPLILLKAISESACEEVLKALLGWVKRVTDKQLEAKDPVVIKYSDFHKRLVSCAKKFDRSDALSSAIAEIPEDMRLQELKSRIYVRQLQLIDLDEDFCLRAVADFLQAGVDRTEWSECGDVHESSFVEFEKALQRAWTDNRGLVNVQMSGRAPKDRGQCLYFKCMKHQVRLQGLEVPSHFTPGSYHALADSLRIGWHPTYRVDVFSQFTQTSVDIDQAPRQGGPCK